MGLGLVRGMLTALGVPPRQAPDEIAQVEAVRLWRQAKCLPAIVQA